MKIRIKHPRQAIKLVRPLITDVSKEHVIGIYLDSSNYVIATEVIGIGILNQSLIHPREVFRPAVQYAAAGLVLLHNHPTGDVRPSGSDVKATRQVKKAGEILGVVLLDHIIFSGGGSFYSLKGNHKM